MSRLRKSWKLALGLILAVVVLQVAASLLVRTHHVHDRLELQLSRAFGRSVQVRHFDVQILPVPTLGAEAITVGEDPAFGNEYFLRADEMSAGLRWLGLLRGRLELGTISLNRPSVILVRNAEGRWNLERWLPPAKRSSAVYGPVAPPGPVNRLRRIDFDDGRLNFKMQDDKGPFAFTNVSGMVEQVSPGRWRLQLEATPWRSGVALQSTGTFRVEGDIAGTSARLQPAELQIHWDSASLADVLRLWHGQDLGMRGTFALDAGLKSSSSTDSATSQPSAWDFTLQARASGLHRWDLGERSDNPRLSLRASGKWFSDTRAIEATKFHLEAPQSSVKGEFTYGGHTGEGLTLRASSVALQARDLLAFYRAFHPGVDDGLAVQQFFSGSFAARGWPLRVSEVELTSLGGNVQVPGLASLVRIGAMRLTADGRSVALQPVVLSWLSAANPNPDATPAKTDGKRRAPEGTSSVTLEAGLNFASLAGGVSVSGAAAEVADALRLAAAFGHPLQHGWELSGGVAAALRWQWKDAPFRGRWNGTINFTNVQLQAAGLNFPVSLSDARLVYEDGRRQGDIRAAQAFGGHWKGRLEEQSGDSTDTVRWRFGLTADHLDAAELDRWVGPRARPNWLQRLLSSMLGTGSAASAAPSDLLRRVNAEGALNVGELTVGKLKLQNVRASAHIRDLRLQIRDASADWAGGTLRASLSSIFAPQPSYDFSAQLDRINLAEVPGGLPERVAGVVEGTLHLTAAGVGRDALLESLAGEGDLSLRNVEFRGWDLDASLADGAAHSGVSRWSGGRCSFRLADRMVAVRSLRLENGKDTMLVSGKVSLAPNLELALETNSAKRLKAAGSVRVLKISGPLDQPRVSVENSPAASPAD
jgi:uncharacterized protein involved in outer membrane biogenesis